MLPHFGLVCIGQWADDHAAISSPLTKAFCTDSSQRLSPEHSLVLGAKSPD